MSFPAERLQDHRSHQLRHHRSALFGEMTLAATFEEVSGGTEVTLLGPYRVNGASIGRADRLILAKHI
jgi:hypothetical protein